MKLKRIMIAAPGSGSGKTTVTCALLRILAEMGQRVCAYKCGPDYIDPMFHRTVIGVPSKNLDTFFTGEERTKELFLKERTEQDFAVLEGVMGLFDGLGGTREEGSAYHLAKVTKTPVLLVVDAKGMGRSVLPLIAGFLAYDTEHLIQGVILNRMSKSYYEIIKPLIEKELKAAVVGYVPNEKNLHIESRHLGLLLPDEISGLRERLGEAAEQLKASVSMERILQIAESAEELELSEPLKQTEAEKTAGKSPEPVLAVAKDEAFCFYYEDNLRLMDEYGAKIRYFSPLHDTSLPEGTAGILIGGGYPELYLKELAANEKIHTEILTAFRQGMPFLAECGGFMYLHTAIVDQEGTRYPMAGVLPGECFGTGTLVRFGYIEIREKQSLFLPEGEIIRGHEFHYFDSTDNGADCVAQKPVTGREYSCIMEGETYCIGFPHLYYPSNPEFVKRWVEKMRKYQAV